VILPDAPRQLPLELLPPPLLELPPRPLVPLELLPPTPRPPRLTVPLLPLLVPIVLPEVPLRTVVPLEGGAVEPVVAREPTGALEP
jgi:hypothetical protein